ncbi:hypothetical protein HY495_02995 [Candidatus Woesearchaeota archaeon]|nr:hypothetical protein [Candidatus Woesearchaeota archaeon]
MAQRRKRRKFTQAELEAAYEQMKEERAEDYRRACSARDNLVDDLGTDALFVGVELTSYSSQLSPPPSPFHSDYRLFIQFRTGCEGEWKLSDSEKNAPFFDVLAGQLTEKYGIATIHSRGPFGLSPVEIETPSGKYSLRLEHILNG